MFSELLEMKRQHTALFSKLLVAHTGLLSVTGVHEYPERKKKKTIPTSYSLSVNDSNHVLF